MKAGAMPLHVVYRVGSRIDVWELFGRLNTRDVYALLSH